MESHLRAKEPSVPAQNGITRVPRQAVPNLSHPPGGFTNVPGVYQPGRTALCHPITTATTSSPVFSVPARCPIPQYQHRVPPRCPTPQNHSICPSTLSHPTIPSSRSHHAVPSHNTIPSVPARCPIPQHHPLGPSTHTVPSHNTSTGSPAARPDHPGGGRGAPPAAHNGRHRCR